MLFLLEAVGAQSEDTIRDDSSEESACFRLALPSAAGPLSALWQGLPVAYPKHRLSAPHRCLTGWRAAVLFNPVPEPAPCDQELKLLCKELRRRAGAGRDRRAAPTTGLQPPVAATTRRRANLEVEVHELDCSSIRPGVLPSVRHCPARGSE